MCWSLCDVATRHCPCARIHIQPQTDAHTRHIGMERVDLSQSEKIIAGIKAEAEQKKKRRKTNAASQATEEAAQEHEEDAAHKDSETERWERAGAWLNASRSAILDSEQVTERRSESGDQRRGWLGGEGARQGRRESACLRVLCLVSCL